MTAPFKKGAFLASIVLCKYLVIILSKLCSFSDYLIDIRNQMPKTYSVTEINKYIKGVLDADYTLRNVQVQGEISNFKRYQSGHCYFSLKDGGSAVDLAGGAGGYSSSRYGSINEGGSVLKCVMFRYKAMDLRFEPKNGDKVIAVGKIQVFERDGTYQLYTDLLLQQGTGDLMQQYEQLKAKLAAEGLFDEERKQALPSNAQRIGIVTSPSGAAVHDIITVSRRRNPGIKLYLYPVLVQGKGAAEEVARAIRFFNEKQLVDVLIVGRGGGSMEDLWAFNEEPTVRAVAASRIPIISAVGHETDFTLCDFAADKRAATPSQAAEMAAADMSKLSQQCNALAERLQRAMQWQLSDAENKLTKHKQCRMLQNPHKLYELQEEKLLRLKNAYVLQEPTRIYAAKAEQLQRLQSSWVFKEPQRLLADSMQRLDMDFAQLVNLMQQRKQQAEHQLALNRAKLEAISPYAVFKRGYSCTLDSKNKIISSVEQVRWGDEIITSVKDGQIISVVQEVERR